MSKPKKSSKNTAGVEKIAAFRSRASRQELYAVGKSLREKCPRSSHAAWQPAANRPEPISLVLQADEGRLPELLPLRHGRMALSPFTFYRGSALAMAVDLAGTPATGVRVQCGGDSHLVNFRGLGTPERQVIFAINDLDETLPAPWEWDLKRLPTPTRTKRTMPCSNVRSRTERSRRPLRSRSDSFAHEENQRGIGNV